MPPGQNADQDQPREPFDRDPITGGSRLRKLGLKVKRLCFISTYRVVWEEEEEEKRSSQPSVIKQTLKQIRGHGVFTSDAQK